MMWIPLQVLLFSIVGLFPDALDYWYGSLVYPIIYKVLSGIFVLVPIPVGQAIVILLIGLIGFKLYRFLIPFRSIKTKWLQFISGTLAAVSVIYFLFMLLWGLNYHRNDLYTTLQYEECAYSTEQLATLCKAIIQKTNDYRDQISPDTTSAVQFHFSKEEMAKEGSFAYNHDVQFSPKYEHNYASVKFVFAPTALSHLGIGGIYFPFTGEANINGDLPEYLQPFTICHEIAHQLGYAREDEANYLSFKVCSRHRNTAFRYSGYLAALKYTMSELHFQDEEMYDSLFSFLSPAVQKDLAHNRAYWSNFDTSLADYSSDINDLFLKMNAQDEGTFSYGLVVDLLLAEFEKQGSI